MREQVITNAQIVLGDEMIKGSLKICDGVISDISSTRSHLPSSLDFDGDILIPGLIELHTDNLERHIMPRPKSYWPVKAAVHNHDREVSSAGITTVYDAICIGESDDGARSDEILYEVAEAISSLSASGVLKSEHFIHWRCEVSGDGIQDKLPKLSEIDRTGLISVMDHTPGQRQFVSIDAYYTYYQGKFGLSDAEMKRYMDERIAAQQKNSEPNRKAVVELAKTRNIPLASHDDATHAHVNEAIEDGIVVAEFPTTLEAAEASHDNGLAVLMGSPNVVRGKSHSGNVSARDLAKAGVLDILSSDYVPFSLLHGATILEQCCDGITLADAIATVTRNPAKQIGLDDRGEIATGKQADIVRYRMGDDCPHVVEVWRSGERVA